MAGVKKIKYKACRSLLSLADGIVFNFPELRFAGQRTKQLRVGRRNPGLNF